MKKALLFGLALVFSAVPAFCHPPKSIDLKLTDGTLEILIEHSVKDPVKHFIDDVTVQLNGKQVVKQAFRVQKDKVEQTAVYLLHGLVKGDKIKVSADCNKGGDLSKELLVP